MALLKSLNFESVYPVSSVIGRELGGYTQNVSTIPTYTQNSGDGERLTIDERFYQTMDRIYERLSIPLNSYVNYLGKGGIKEVIERHNKLSKRGNL